MDGEFVYFGSLVHSITQPPPRRPLSMWMKTIQQDLKSNNLSLNEAIGVTRNRPL